MQKVVNVEEVYEEIKRLKIEIQRLEAMLIPETKPKDEGFPEITDEDIEELLKEAQDPDAEWVKLEELPKPEE